jgi:hypothetical protein
VATSPGNSTAIVRLGTSFSNNISAAIEPMYNGGGVSQIGGQTSLTGYANQVIVSSSSAGSFAFQRGSGSTSFASIQDVTLNNITPSSFGTPFSSSSSVVYADLYSVLSGSAGTAATLLGTFALTDSGLLTFTGTNYSAVPEPSTYALVGGVFALGVAFYRRRRATA